MWKGKLIFKYLMESFYDLRHGTGRGRIILDRTRRNEIPEAIRKECKDDVSVMDNMKAEWML